MSAPGTPPPAGADGLLHRLAVQALGRAGPQDASLRPQLPHPFEHEPQAAESDALGPGAPAPHALEDVAVGGGRTGPGSHPLQPANAPGAERDAGHAAVGVASLRPVPTEFPSAQAAPPVSDGREAGGASAAAARLRTGLAVAPAAPLAAPSAQAAAKPAAAPRHALAQLAWPTPPEATPGPSRRDPSAQAAVRSSLAGPAVAQPSGGERRGLRSRAAERREPEAAPALPPPEPVIEIHIGRIEVRAALAASAEGPPSRASAPASPQPSLARYLAARSRGSRS